MTIGKWLANFCLSFALLTVGCMRHQPVYATHSAKTPITTTRPGVLVCLDAGHGGHDPGCEGGGLQEKQLTLTTTLMVKRHLEAMGYQVLLTRDKDRFIPLTERAQQANEAHCTLFVSIHYNAAASTQANGVEVFCFSQSCAEAHALADAILCNVTRYSGAKSRGVKEENFAVLRETTMPAALIEGGFLTNEGECARLGQPRYLNAVAWGITQGIHTHLLSPSST